MGDMNCRECIGKDSNHFNELSLGEEKEKNNKDGSKIEYDKTKTRNEFTKNDEKDSEFSKNNIFMGLEDNEIINKISHNFERIKDLDNDECIQKYNNSSYGPDTKVNEQQEINFNFNQENNEEGRYIEPYGQNYQDYDLNNLEFRQGDDYINNDVGYISYKDLNISRELWS